MSKPRKAKSETATKAAVPADQPLNPTKSEAHTGEAHSDFSDGTPSADEAGEKARARNPHAGAAAAPAADTPTAVKPIPEAKVLAATTGATVSALALCVLVTLPPVEKFEAGKGYWQIEIADQKGQRYSNVYRCTSLDKAKSLANTIATERHIPIVTKEPPTARTVTEPTPPADTNDDGVINASDLTTDDDMVMPF